MDDVKQIPKEFKRNGLMYILIKRTSLFALYSVFNKQKVCYGYEVHKIRILPTPHSWKGIVELRYERLASNEEFGKYGWSFNSLEDAEKRFEELDKL